jgi:hypothetical protein
LFGGSFSDALPASIGFSGLNGRDAEAAGAVLDSIMAAISSVESPSLGSLGLFASLTELASVGLKGGLIAGLKEGLIMGAKVAVGLKGGG